MKYLANVGCLLTSLGEPIEFSENVLVVHEILIVGSDIVNRLVIPLKSIIWVLLPANSSAFVMEKPLRNAITTSLS